MAVVPQGELIEQRVRDAAGAPPPGEAEQAFRRALAALGMSTVPSEEAADVRGRYANVAAFYDRRAKSITVLDRGEPLDSEESFLTLVHELAHAEQHRDGAFDSGPPVTTIDESLARLAMTEGEATLIEMRARVRLDGYDEADVVWSSWLSEYRGRTETRAAASDDFYRDASMFFPYSWGATYVLKHYEAEGQAGVRKLYGDQRARSTLEVMRAGFATQLAFGHTPEKLGVVAPSDPWRLDSVSHLGAWFVKHFGQRMGIQDLGRGMSGDALNVLALPKEGLTDVVPLWRIELTSSSSAAELAFHSRLRSSNLSMAQAGSSLWFTTRASVAPKDLRWAAQEKPDLFFAPEMMAADEEKTPTPHHHVLARSLLPPPVYR